MTDIREIPVVDGLKARLFENIPDGRMTECWEWGGSLNYKGYGRLKINGDYYRATRTLMRLLVGPLGQNFVLHHCDNPSCVNPDHLYLGDASDNMQDAWKRGRKNASGENNPNASLSEKDVREIRERYARHPELSQADLADEYGMARSTFSSILRGDYWPEAGGPTTKTGT